MLQLVTRKYQNTYTRSSYAVNQSEPLICGHNVYQLQNHAYRMRGINSLYHVDLPLHMKGLNLKLYHFIYDNTVTEGLSEVQEGIKDILLRNFNDAEDEDVVIITGYIADDTIYNKEHEYNFIDKDLWKEHKDDSIITLYNKCVEQTSLRESERQVRNIQQHIRVFQSRSKHMILLLTDYQDYDQESEKLLTIGLTPVLFEDLKERFEPLEIDYFKVLVNRSQVKRISNTKAIEAFSLLESIESYHDIERAIRYKTLFNIIANARVKISEAQARDCRSSMESALRSYDNALKRLSEIEIVIEKYKEGTSEIVQELEVISKTKGVYDIQTITDDTVKITLRVPLDYFDMDEAECAIRNINNSDVKRFLTEIFIEQKYKLYILTDAYYAFSVNGSFRDFTAINESVCHEANALFNPHFQFYHCLGDYKPSLIKAMRDQDIVMFTNIGIAAAKSINFKDGAVMRQFTTYLANAFSNGDDYILGIKCLEKDGKLYTLRQWLYNKFNEEPEEIQTIEAEDL